MNFRFLMVLLSVSLLSVIVGGTLLVLMGAVLDWW